MSHNRSALFNNPQLFCREKVETIDFEECFSFLNLKQSKFAFNNSESVKGSGGGEGYNVVVHSA